MKPLLELFEIRRDNLRTLADNRSAKQLALDTNLSPSRLTQLIGPNPSRNISEGTALEIENVLGLQQGWLSIDRSAETVEE